MVTYILLMGFGCFAVLGAVGVIDSFGIIGNITSRPESESSEAQPEPPKTRTATFMTMFAIGVLGVMLVELFFTK